MDKKHVIYMQWVLGKKYLTLNFLYTEYGLQGSDFHTVGLPQLTSHEQNGKAHIKTPEGNDATTVMP